MGEWTEVASAKRAVRGVLMESTSEEVDDVRDLTDICVSFSLSFSFSSSEELCSRLLRVSKGETVLYFRG